MTLFATGVGRGLSRLSFSDQTVVAIEQAMLDWQHESSGARSLAGRAWFALRFALALFRIFISLTAADLADAVSLGWGARLAFWLAAITWLSFSPAPPAREHAAAENIVRLWLSFSSAMLVAPALTVWTARSKGRAPTLALALLSIAAVTIIATVVVPYVAAGLPGFAVRLSWRFTLMASLASTLLIAIAERSRTDQRRWLVTGVLAAAVMFPVVAANAAKVAVWLSDTGIITGDVVYLPRIPMSVQIIFSESPWPRMALLMVALTWLIARHSRARRQNAC